MGVYSIVSSWRSERSERLKREKAARLFAAASDEEPKRGLSFLESAFTSNQVLGPTLEEITTIQVELPASDEHRSKHQEVMNEFLSSAFDLQNCG